MRPAALYAIVLALLAIATAVKGEGGGSLVLAVGSMVEAVIYQWQYVSDAHHSR